MKLEYQIVSTQTILNNILEIIKPAAEAKNIKFIIENKNAELQWYVHTDSVRIRQIFINLLSNAVKFTPEGGQISFGFECLGRDEMISHDCFKIRDTGIGMSREFIENRLFKPFSQEQSMLSTQYAGSGLGLSIVYSLVEMMGGHIEVESELGKGTTFTLYLDLKRVSDEEAKRFLQNGKSQTSTMVKLLKGRNILLVEDHPLNAEITMRILKKAGCHVVWADDGSKGVQTFLQSAPHYYDAVLMDIRMPVMNGLEAAKAIRRLNRTDALTVPIIAMTANAYDEDVQKTIEAGMNSHLAKPVEAVKLYDTLVKYIMSTK